MKRKTRRITALVLGVLASLCLSLSSAAEEKTGISVGSRFYELIVGESGKKTLCLCPGGGVFGIRIHTGEVTVSEVGEDGSPFAVGDRILEVDGTPVDSPEKLSAEVRRSDGTIEVTVMRKGAKLVLPVEAVSDAGEYRLGVSVREGAAGIGTVTFVDPQTGAFGGLGHGICDPETGEVLPMISGETTPVTLGGVMRGEVGAPGELHGALRHGVTGILRKNCECGVFGKFTTLPEGLVPVPVAGRGEVKVGAAEVLSTVKNGETKRYAIEITSIEPGATGNKCFTVRVTDPELIAKTGGIVRGMSGSPILQDGKLVGALTHVMVADPMSGYGIFIDNMLSSMPSEVSLAA